MRTSLSALSGNFIENRDIVKSYFPWESSYLYPVCAAIFTDKRIKADPAQLKNCKNLLKSQSALGISMI